MRLASVTLFTGWWNPSAEVRSVRAVTRGLHLLKPETGIIWAGGRPLGAHGSRLKKNKKTPGWIFKRLIWFRDVAETGDGGRIRWILRVCAERLLERDPGHTIVGLNDNLVSNTRLYQQWGSLYREDCKLWEIKKEREIIHTFIISINLWRLSQHIKYIYIHLNIFWRMIINLSADCWCEKCSVTPEDYRTPDYLMSSAHATSWKWGET